MASSSSAALSPSFASNLVEVLRRALGTPGALPDDWDPRATTYDLPRFDSEAKFAERLDAAVARLVAENVTEPAAIREALAACGLPYDYARLGQPLSTVYELLLRARTGASHVFSFASVTKPWLSVIEAPGRTLPVRVFAAGELPISEAEKVQLRGQGVELHERHEGPVTAGGDAITVHVLAVPFAGDVTAQPADVVCFTVPNGGVLLLRDEGRVAAKGIQLIRKRTVAAILAVDALHALERDVGLPSTTEATSTPEACDAKLRALFPQITEVLYFCTGLAAEAAVFAAAADVLGPAPVTFFYAQNGYGGTGQLIAAVLAPRTALAPAPLPVLGTDAGGRPITIVDGILARLDALEGAPAIVFLETPTNPELQAHDFGKLVDGLRAYASRHGHRIPVLVDTTLAPLYPVFGLDCARDWPFLLVKSGSKYFTRGKTTLGVAACASDPIAKSIISRARTLGTDADSFALPSQLALLESGLSDLVPRMATIRANTLRLVDGLREALAARGHDIALYAMTEAQAREGLDCGLVSFYLPPAPTESENLVDEFVDHLVATAPSLVKSRVSYGQSTGDGKPDAFYVINPQESTQGSLPQAVKDAQKRGDVQICRASVPEHADVGALLAAMEPFFTRKYGPRR